MDIIQDKIQPENKTEKSIQWFKNGDHPEDDVRLIPSEIDGQDSTETEGKVVRYYRDPLIDGLVECHNCGNAMFLHGWIDALENGRIVCPGDWLKNDENGIPYPYKNDRYGYIETCYGDKTISKLLSEKTINKIIDHAKDLLRLCDDLKVNSSGSEREFEFSEKHLSSLVLGFGTNFSDDIIAELNNANITK